MASAVTGYVSTYGVDEPAGCYEDLDKCDVLITWGNNLAEMHPVLFSRIAAAWKETAPTLPCRQRKCVT